MTILRAARHHCTCAIDVKKTIFALIFMFLQFASTVQLNGTLQVRTSDTLEKSRDPKLIALENFLLAQYNSSLGLVKESPDPSINQTYWLLGDNLLAYHALKDRHPEIANRIYQTITRYGYPLQDGLHEALFGNEIPLPPYTPKDKIVEQGTAYTVKVEYRNPSEANVMDDWVDYADILLYASLGFYNQPSQVKQVNKALYYFNMAKDMWNEAGLYDKPTRLNGYYTTYKLALLLFASLVLNQTLPFRSTLEDRIWKMQRDDGGVRSHYLGNLTSHREANTETASLILIAYNYQEAELSRERSALEQREVEQKASEERELLMQTIVLVVLVAGASIIAVIAVKLLNRRSKKELATKSRIERLHKFPI